MDAMPNREPEPIAAAAACLGVSLLFGADATGVDSADAVPADPACGVEGAVAPALVLVLAGGSGCCSGQTITSFDATLIRRRQ